MRSPVKAITTGTLVVAIGGVMLVAQPFGQQASVLAAEPEGGWAEAVPFTMSFSWRDPSVRPPGELTEDGVTKSIGECWAPAIVAPSDPRMEGTLEYCGSEHVYGEDREADPLVYTETYRIVNDEGAWQGSGYGAWWGDPGSGETMDTGVPIILTGEGAYDGLYAALAFVDAWADIRGLIFEGPLPAQVLPPSAGLANEPVADTAETVAFTELRVADVAVVDERTRDLTIESPSVGEATVRLLLPAGFDEDADRTYPVLYLLHGATGDHTNWTEESDLAELTADLDLLVVMPDGGDQGWYSDWWNEGEGGASAWETFHLDEVRDIIERDWQAGEERAIAGLSMGGYGAMHYATAHPELFTAVASFSGVVDPVGGGFRGDDRLWGDPLEQADIWAVHDPVGMAESLAGMPVYLSWADGEPGPLDPEGTGADDLEAWVSTQNEALAARLAELGIDATIESGPGTHTWPYWEQGLHHALPMLLDALER